MADKFVLLEEKVNQVLERLENFKEKNTDLTTQNETMKSELTKLGQEVTALKRDQNDLRKQLKEKLVSLLGRVEDLEKLDI